jgi:mannose-6-phosphate isomerase-like protein (cupin superfamily)
MIRRVVTGDVDGKGVITSDSPAPVHDVGGTLVHEIWISPRSDGSYRAGEEWALLPSASNSIFRIADIPPARAGDQPHMHSTDTIDFGVIIEGELTLVLDATETVLKPGDTFVQRQANHGWINRGPARVRMAVVLVEGSY